MELLMEKALTCGLVMPISAIDGCSSEHWLEVKNILTEAVEAIAEPVFSVKLVSDSDDVGVIQKRIVQNVYSSDVIVCDVSGKNPNVMFELGMRLAFDKPTIIVKDDKTDYAFDTGIIEHISYPRDLRFSRVVAFRKLVAEKVLSTYLASVNQPDHSVFLKNFGAFKVASLNESEIPADKLVLDLLAELQGEVSMLRRTFQRESRGRLPSDLGSGFEIKLIRIAQKYLDENKDLKAQDLVGNQDFHAIAERAVDAPRHFGTSMEFESALKKVLTGPLVELM
jgi:hypothetical protein